MSSPSAPPALRNPLFVPGTRLELLEKVARSGPDAVIVDLEDAVVPDEKAAARRGLNRALNRPLPRLPAVLVRINPTGSPWHAQDVAACAELARVGAVAGVVVPKAESAQAMRSVAAALPAQSLLVAGLETARGVATAQEVLSAGVCATYFGAEDYIADVGGRRSASGAEVLFARSQVVLAAAVAGVVALDQAVLAVRDAEAFRRDAMAGRDLGYAGKVCLHPDQVPIAAAVFSPSPEELAHARTVVAAARDGVAVVDGTMVDAVHLRMAQAVLARAGQEGD